MPFWKSPAFLIIGSQLLFSISDVIGARAMKTQGFTPAAFLTWWFLLYTLIRQIAVFGQLYIYSSMELGRSVALFGAGSIIIGNVMLTDSRSFLSFPRHEYFRRILCNLIGTEADRGELPDDFDALSKLIADVCSGNAQRYFGF